MHRTHAGVKQLYTSRLNDYSIKLTETRKIIRKTSSFRIILFLGTLIGIYLASGYNWLLLSAIATTGFSLFIFLIIRHAKLYKQKKWLEALEQLNKTELSLMEGDTSEKLSGANWLDPEHPFASDLDIFGKGSLFQLINRSATENGRKRLVSILMNPLKDIKQIKDRQEAIKELTNRIDFRQYFQVTGNLNNEEKNTLKNLINWIHDDQYSYNTVFNKIFLFLNPLIGLSVVVLILTNILSFSSFLLFLVLPFLILTPKLRRINEEYGKLGRKSQILEKYAVLLKLIEDENFSAGILVYAQNILVKGSYSASKSIDKLSKISAAFDYRLNLLVGILLNVFCLWDILQLIRLEKWKKANRKHIDDWFNNLAHIDELCSFSGFAFNNPDAVFPEVTGDQFVLKVKNARHPFISYDLCIGNDVSFSGWKQFHIITGANMAGKSTYLRTVGINILLGMTGSPVLADKFVFKPVSLFTGIKTNDSLQDGESYFFAELKRLETMIRNLENGEKLFIILDEILRGTNSEDKRKGSKALISQFVKLGASGMIATHDLALGELIESFPDKIVNKRFEVELMNDELVFDYKLKDGISQNLNATFLMKKMGITLEK